LSLADSTGQRTFFVQAVPAHLTPKPKLPGKTVVPCLICGKNLVLNKMREHVGGHILLSLHHIEDSSSHLAKIGAEPCGFCGLDGCVTQL
ncbi:hypothetical protein C8R43DRAFT_838586, partial [Mycena crocata]